MLFIRYLITTFFNIIIFVFEDNSRPNKPVQMAAGDSIINILVYFCIFICLLLLNLDLLLFNITLFSTERLFGAAGD